MKLDFEKLGARELKELSTLVKTERERRGKKNPTNHSTPFWTVPNVALVKEKPMGPP